jgi:hypothetical protein
MADQVYAATPLVYLVFPQIPAMTKIHRQKITKICCVLRVAGLLGRTLKNCAKKTTPKFFTSQLATRNSQPSPPGSKKLAVDFGETF